MANDYENWTGRRAYSPKGNLCIETTTREWCLRLKTWQEHKNDLLCPCPMPVGHIIFKGIKASRQLAYRQDSNNRDARPWRSE